MFKSTINFIFVAFVMAACQNGEPEKSKALDLTSIIGNGVINIDVTSNAVYSLAYFAPKYVVIFNKRQMNDSSLASYATQVCAENEKELKSIERIGLSHADSVPDGDKAIFYCK